MLLWCNIKSHQKGVRVMGTVHHFDPFARKRLVPVPAKPVYEHADSRLERFCYRAVRTTLVVTGALGIVAFLLFVVWMAVVGVYALVTSDSEWVLLLMAVPFFSMLLVGKRPAVRAVPQSAMILYLARPADEPPDDFRPAA